MLNVFSLPTFARLISLRSAGIYCRCCCIDLTRFPAGDSASNSVWFSLQMAPGQQAVDQEFLPSVTASCQGGLMTIKVETRQAFQGTPLSFRSAGIVARLVPSSTVRRRSIAPNGSSFARLEFNGRERSGREWRLERDRPAFLGRSSGFATGGPCPRGSDADEKRVILEHTLGRCGS